MVFLTPYKRNGDSERCRCEANLSLRFVLPCLTPIRRAKTGIGSLRERNYTRCPNLVCLNRRVYPGSCSRHPLGPCLPTEALFIFKCDSQGCAKSCDELSHIILPVCFLGKIAALAPTRTEIIQEWLAGLRRRNSQ